MSKLTDPERMDELPEKVELLYNAVLRLFEEGKELADITVSSIANQAGIGKGTTYDYFDSKEDLIASAMFYFMRRTTLSLTETLLQKETFAEQIDCLLDWVEKSLSERKCFDRFLHQLTDSSLIGQLIRQKMEENTRERFFPIIAFRKILDRALKKGEVRDDLPLDYMAYTIYSRVISHMTFLHMERLEGGNWGEMRHYVYQGILEEFRVRTDSHGEGLKEEGL